MSAFLDGRAPRAFAHRGWHIGDLSGCENSMAAFRRAADEGFQYLETDVHLTADKVLIAFHDAVLDRVTNSTGRVESTPWAQIRDARISGREPIPTFADVLELLRDRPELRLNVDAKSDAVVGPLLDALTGSGLTDRVCVAAFSDARLSTLTSVLGPTVASSLGPRGVARLRFGRMRRVPAGCVAAQVPASVNRLLVVTRGFLAAAHSLDLEVHIWTIDDPQEMVRLLDLGADGIMTDRPDLLRRVLQQRGSWQ